MANIVRVYIPIYWKYLNHPLPADLLTARQMPVYPNESKSYPRVDGKAVANSELRRLEL